MKISNSVSRREFTLKSALAALAGATITITACDGDNSNPTAPTNFRGDITGIVSANHAHDAHITDAALTNGGALVLDIRGDADHQHTVQLTMDEVTQIEDGARVSKESSVEPSASFGTHSHTVTFN
jgi:hypothetical protein